MKKFLKSLFSSSEEPPAADREVESEKAPHTTGEPAASSLSSADPPVSDAADVGRQNPPASLEQEDIIAALVAQVCATMPDPRPAEEIDPEIHMYDAGYVTSISAADLLAFVDEHYGLDISETKLIGPLQNLAALAKHIREHALVVSP